MITYQLTPQHSSQKSFYGKANVRKEFIGTGYVYTLTSYTTDVATIFQNGNGDFAKATVYDTHSPTTLKHIKEFLKQYGYKAETKKQIEEDYA